MTKIDLIAKGYKMIDILKENGPKIAFYTGLGVGAIAIGKFIYDTTKLDSILDEHEESVAEVKESLENKEFDEKEYKKQMTYVYGRTALHIGRNYAGSIALYGTSVALECVAFSKLDKRLSTAIATSTALATQLAGIRGRIENKYGSEEAFNIMHGVETEQYTEEVVDPETGKKKKVKKEKKLVKEDPSTLSFFLGQDYCSCWNYEWSDEENFKFILKMISGAITNTNSEINRKTWVWGDKIVERMGGTPTDIHRTMAVTYDPNYPMEDQFSINRNVVIHKDLFSEYGEKVLLIEIKDVVPNFKISEWDEVACRKKQIED